MVRLGFLYHTIKMSLFIYQNIYMTQQRILTWCCSTSFPAGELWHAVQPHWRWEDLPEGLWWSESQVWERRSGTPMLLCSRQDRTLATAYTLWKGKSTHLFSIFFLQLSLYIKEPLSLRSSSFHVSVCSSVFCLVASLWHQLLCWVLCPGPSDGKWRV